MRSLRLALCVVASLALPLASGCASHSDGDAADDGSGATAGQDLAAGAKKKGGPARFKQMKSGPTNKALAGLSTAGNKVDSSLDGTFKFLKPTNEGSDAGARETRVKEVMHKFMCSFFDEAIVITHRSGAAGTKKAVEDLDFSSNTESDGSAVEAAVGKVATDGDLDLLTGQASGNNTFGSVLGVYDKKNNEVYFFGFTNCGSDN